MKLIDLDVVREYLRSGEKTLEGLETVKRALDIELQYLRKKSDKGGGMAENARYVINEDGLGNFLKSQIAPPDKDQAIADLLLRHRNQIDNLLELFHKLDKRIAAIERPETKGGPDSAELIAQIIRSLVAK